MMAFWPPPGNSAQALGFASATMLDIAGTSLGVAPAVEAINFPTSKINIPENFDKRYSVSQCYCSTDFPSLKPPCYSCIYRLKSPPPSYTFPHKFKSSTSEPNIVDDKNLGKHFHNELKNTNMDEKTRSLNLKLTNCLRNEYTLDNSSKNQSSLIDPLSLLSCSFRETLDPITLCRPEDKRLSSFL